MNKEKDYQLVPVVSKVDFGRYSKSYGFMKEYTNTIEAEAVNNKVRIRIFENSITGFDLLSECALDIEHATKLRERLTAAIWDVRKKRCQHEK